MHVRGIRLVVMASAACGAIPIAAHAAPDITVNGGTVTVSAAGTSVSDPAQVVFDNGASTANSSYDTFRQNGGTVNFQTGSAVTGNFFQSFNTGTVTNFFDGAFPEFDSFGGTQTNISGGSFADFTAFGDADISGGTLANFSTRGSHVTISDGNFTGPFSGSAGSVVDISGGTIGTISGTIDAQFNITGGNISALTLHDSLVIRLYGTFPTYGTFVVSTNPYPDSTITGTLADGTPINAAYSAVATFPDATLVLSQVPEPDTAGLLLLAIAGGGLLRRKVGGRH